ncbi:hypothetical protein RvY_08505 [Ramazzottius varieornatus]|uniref:Uncharacterized protein n=1 Tax=Ramazzottius varieornatus TaxID=947166 RepID=A0A1D1VE39_RAMVA|nr:hypothetical protein RvY_08505 [Ramazzottius varieornatus]
MLPMEASDEYLDGNLLPSLPASQSAGVRADRSIGRTRMASLYLTNSQIESSSYSTTSKSACVTKKGSWV